MRVKVKRNTEPCPLLLLGVSRSGTTLFQRVLNSYDDVIVWGEHAGYLTNLAESYFTITTSKSMEEFSFPQAKGDSISINEYKNPKMWQAWNNWFNRDDIRNIYKEFILQSFAANWRNVLTYWGFKEIRYGEGDKVVEFFMDLFPEVRIVIIHRNPLNVIESQLSSFENISGRLAKVRKLFLIKKIFRMALRWNKKNLQYLRYLEKYPESVTFFSFEEMISNAEILSSILWSLGLELTERQLEILKIKEGRGSAFSSEKGKAQSTDTRWKKLGIIPSLLVYLLTKDVYTKIKLSTLVILPEKYQESKIG